MCVCAICLVLGTRLVSRVLSCRGLLLAYWPGCFVTLTASRRARPGTRQEKNERKRRRRARPKSEGEEEEGFGSSCAQYFVVFTRCPPLLLLLLRLPLRVGRIASRRVASQHVTRLKESPKDVGRAKSFLNASRAHFFLSFSLSPTRVYTHQHADRHKKS